MRALTFLSDFGAGSPYPAAMKAVAAGISDARFIDISHAVPRHDIRAGAYLLWAVVPAFPAGTVHCAVVDPGVGTGRAAIAVASGGQFFVGPDNGLLIPAARRLGIPAVYALTRPAYWRHPVSATFAGRDVFAPAAAHLAAGARLEDLGTPAPTHVDFVFEAGRWDGRALSGDVLWIDPFGNLVTTIPGPMLGRLGGSGRVTVKTGNRRLPAVIAHTFGSVPEASVIVLVGSDGLVEVALNRGSAAAATGAAPGDAVRIYPEGVGATVKKSGSRP